MITCHCYYVYIPAHFSANPTRFTAVILSNPSHAMLDYMVAECSAQSVPLILTRSCGLLGIVDVRLRDQYTIPSSSDTYDLRIACPFPELEVRYIEILKIPP